jgi:hypothetical protein
MINYFLNITPTIPRIMSWNSRSKYVNKVKLIIAFDLVNQKSYVDLVVLQSDLFVPQCDLSIL